VSSGEISRLGREEKRRLLAELLAKRAARPHRFPLSFAQERLWFLDRLQPGGSSYRIAAVLSVRGPLRPAVLAASLGELVRRHESLRTTFADEEGQAAQIVSPDVRFDLAEADLREIPAAEREPEARRAAAALLETPFDLGRGPLLRLALLRLAEDRWVMLLAQHHIVSDGWSLSVLLGELVTLYGAFAAGRPSPLPEPRLQYPDYAAWQRDWLRGEILAERLGYWREQLAGASALELPGDRPRPPVQTFRGAAVPFLLPPSLRDRLLALAQSEGATLFMVQLAAFQTLLARHSGREDVCLGSPIANRQRPELRGVIGLFANMLVLRTPLDGDPTFREAMGRVRTVVAGAFEHQDLPFEKLVEVLRPERDVSRTPLFQVAFAPQNAPAAELAIPDLEIAPFAADLGTAKFDLTVEIGDGPQGIQGRFEYNSDLFDRTSIERLAAGFERLLAAAAAAPESRLSDLPLLSPAERAQALQEWNDTRAEGGLAGRAIHELFEDVVARSPQAVAVEIGDERVTYRELDARANRLAHHLRGFGVARETLVGIALERSVDLVAAQLGILKAGGAYVPLDPAYPRERLRLMMEEVELPLIVTREPLLSTLPDPGPETRVLLLDREAAALARQSPESPGPAATPRHLAYVMFTSGSTGRPRAVGVEHRSVVRLVRDTGFVRFGPEQVFLQLASPSFDAATLEVWGPLLHGGRLVLFPGAVPSLTDLDRSLARHGVTALWLTAGLFHQVVKHRIESLRPVRQLLAGGDVLSPVDVNSLLETLPGCTLINGYGPTENTTFTCCHTVREPVLPGRSVPIGHPIANTTVYILDRHLQPVPLGAPGELFTGGAGLARGYLGRPELTAERFIPHPFAVEPGSRLYRTGDLVRRLPDGAIEFLGRLDQQVKIRGFRVEPGEIEAVLAGCPVVREAAVLVRQGEAGERSLTACVVPADGEPFTADAVRAFLAERLPQYMVPAQVVPVPSFPLTEHGKLDRRALLGMVDTPEPPRTARALPASDLERTIAAAWRQVLGIDQVGRDESFFDLGGHSLRMVELHAVLQKSLEREISIVELFQYPTVGSFAGYLERGAHAPEGLEEARRRAAGAHAEAAPSRPAFAVVGMAGRFPGADNVDELWANLRDGVESIRTFSDEELIAAGVPAERLASPHYVKAGAVLDGVDLFDADFFGFTPREAEVLDPQQRLFLECAWQALENAGYDPSRERRPVGVYAGAFMCSYAWNVVAHPEIVESMGPMTLQASLDKDFLATRVSYKLGLRGPSVSVQTACSTSLVAVHFACQSLLLGECDLALAGGVTVRVPQQSGYTFLEGDIASPDGHCRAFDAQARGTVGGNGAAVAVLKRLEDALRDGDTIHAVVRGTAINNDGSLKVGYTAPSVEGQAEVIAAAQAAAGVPPETITYVEAHGTGTALGDPIEVAALTRAFGTGRPRSCALGSIKTNIGHLDAAAGIAGFLKTVLALEHRQIPPSLHFREPNPRIDFAAGPFYVNAELADWESDGAPRRAGVSSFGIGGTNAHAILEEAPPRDPSGPSRPRQLLLLSARTPAALEEATAELARSLRRPEAELPPLADIAFTLQSGRQAFAHRRALVCESVDEALAALEGPAPERLLTSHARQERRPVAFLFPGQGAQHVDMGGDLYRGEPVFRRAVDAGAELLAPRLGRDLRELLYPSEGRRDAAERELRETRHAQPALFVIEHALARLWMSWGISPAAMIGHSLGEYVAACLAGVFSFEDALALVAVRGELMQSLAAGAMLSVDLPEAELVEVIGTFPELSLAAVNGPSLGTASGPEPAIAALEALLTARGVSHRRLHTSHAFHSALMEPILGPFAEQVARMERRPPSVPCISNLTGSWLTAAEATDPGYWARHLRAPVRFGDGVARLLSEPLPAGPPVLLEIGPGRTLASLVRQQAVAGAAPAAISSMRHPKDAEPDDAVLLKALGRLWLAGAEVDWRGFSAGERRRRVPLPTYPFQRRRFWIDAPRREAAPLHAVGVAQAEPALEDPVSTAESRPGLETPYREPRDDRERRLARIWEGLLGIRPIGVYDDFFELGGHSLLATRVLAQVREAFGCELPLESFFAAPTVAGIAARIAEQREDGSAPPPIVRVPRTTPLPLSFAQQRLLFLEQLAPGDVSYHLPAVLRLSGELDRQALHAALRRLVERHEVLRTVFMVDESEQRQVIAPAEGRFVGDLPLIDLGALPAARIEPESRRVALEAARLPLDLYRGPILRACLLRFAPTESELLLNIHHVAADGWSWSIVFGEMLELYEALVEEREARLPELPVQYADYAAWQRGWLEGEVLAGQLGYWRERLAGLPLLELPTDRPRPRVRTGNGAVERTWLRGETIEALRRTVREEEATLFMALLAAFSVLLRHASGSDDLAIGTDLANRTQGATERLIGLFVNQLALRIDLSGEPTFRELLRRVRRLTLDAYAHQDAPFDKVVEALNPARDLSRTPLFQVKLVLQNTPAAARRARNLTVTPRDLDTRTAKFDLLFNLTESGPGLDVRVEYSTDLFEAPTAVSLLDGFAAVVRAAASRPDAGVSELTAELRGLDPAARRMRTQERQSQVVRRAQRKLVPVPES
jgi:amino acid adenylation domain-containing protein